MTVADSFKLMVVGCLFPAMLLFGADDSEKPVRRLTIGVHVDYYPFPLIKGGSVITISNNPVAQYNINSTSDSPKWGPGAMVEYRLLPHLSVAGEIHFHHTDYTQTTDTLSGYNTSTTGTDNRPVTTMVETSQVNQYEIPIMAHYYGLWSHGWKSHLYLTGGAQVLHVGKIRTGNDYTYPSGETDYNENPAIPHRANDVGVVAGVGMRFIDEFHIRIAPEIRAIRWATPALLGASYQSRAMQYEANLSISF